jgi:leucyl-tRNA synthetase
MGHVRNYTIGDVLTRFHRMRATTCCSPWAGTPSACPPRTPRCQTGAAGEVDLRQHRLHEEAAQSLGFRHRLGTRAGHLHPRVLQVEPVAVPAHARKGHRLQEDPGGELGPGGPDRARQRAGDRRPRLAHRRHGRKARDPGYYLKITQYADELLGDLDTLPGWPERVKPCRPTGSARAPACASPSRTRAGRRQADGKLWVFTTRADTIMGVTFCAVAAEHPLATHAAKNNPELAAFIDECKHGSVMEADMATMEKKACPPASSSPIRSPASRSRSGSATTC